MAKKKAEKKLKNIKVRLDNPMPFDEFMQRIARVKPPKDSEPNQPK